jgi:SAM-dependent methyltransferase
LRGGCRWLDIGCGPGGNFSLFQAWRPELAVGVDLSPLALDLARALATDARLVRADISKGLPFADGCFDVGTIFNVLYHDWISDEFAVLIELRRVLKRGGLALITEPAFPALAREMDRMAMGSRRYRLAEFRRLCRSAGLEVVLGSYFTSFGAVVLLATKTAAKLVPLARARQRVADIDLKPLNPIVNEVLYRTALVEARAVARGLPMPFGTTLVCLARKCT